MSKRKLCVRKMSFLDALENGKVVAVEGRNNYNVKGFITERMSERNMPAPVVIDCLHLSGTNELFTRMEEVETKSYILRNIEDKKWANEALKKCIDYAANKDYKIIIYLSERQDDIENSYMIKIQGENTFYPDIEGYMMATADQKAVSYLGYITPQNYHIAEKIVIREGKDEGRILPVMKYELGLSMRDPRNIPTLQTREQAVLFVKSCNRDTMVDDYTRKELALIINALKVQGKDTNFRGVMCKRRAVQHIENFMKLHNRKWSL